MACQEVVLEFRLLLARVNTTTRRGQKALVRQQRRMNEAVHCKLILGVNMLADRMLFAQPPDVIMTMTNVKYDPECREGVGYKNQPGDGTGSQD